MTSSLPEKIGRYQILELVGRGGMGVLYRGYDPVLDREVAVKVMLADFSNDTEQMRPRFYREAKAAARLQHRNIVTVFEFAEENNQPHIAMEFLRGVPLNVRMAKAPSLTLDDKLDIVAQLCAGLGYAHSQGVVHRDVKPANVFILEDGTVKLLDFGIAKVSTSTLTQQGDILGSAPYMSPEQVSGSQSIDGRSDVWAIGVLLYELISGRKPFQGEALTTVIVGILKEDPPPLEGMVAGVPKELSDAIVKTLEKDPSRRFQKAEDLGRQLQLIRKNAAQRADLPPMDETRYASTNVLRALHEDRQKQAVAAVVDKTLEGVSAPVPPPPAPAAKTGLILGIAATVSVAAVGLWLWLSRPAENQQTQTSDAKATVSAAPAPQSAQPASPQVPPSSPPSAGAATAVKPIVESKPPATPPETRKSSQPRKQDAAPAGNTATPPAPEKPAPPAERLVTVSVSAPYPFSIRDGGRTVSAAATSHELQGQPEGKTLRLVAPEIFLDLPMRIQGGGDGRFEFSPPPLGRFSIRARREECKATVGSTDLGYGPWPKPFVAVAGEHRITLVCPDGQNPIMAITVTQGLVYPVFFKD